MVSTTVQACRKRPVCAAVQGMRKETRRRVPAARARAQKEGREGREGGKGRGREGGREALLSVHFKAPSASWATRRAQEGGQDIHAIFPC